MNRLIVQVLRAGDWLNVTSVAIEPRSERDRERARAVAFVEAGRQLTAWQSYDGFAGMPLRIAEEAGYGKFVEARP